MTSISGRITWPEGHLTGKVYVFADSMQMPYPYILCSALADTLTGNFGMRIGIHAPSRVGFEAWDDVDRDSILDYGDGYGFFDLNENGNWDFPGDLLTLYPGQDTAGINIQLSIVNNK